MRGTFTFDVGALDYGEATPALRSLLELWQRIDWFEANGADAATAIELFRAHHALCHAARPDLFAAQIEVRTQRGGWADVEALYPRVAEAPDRWDWKYSGLKRLTKDHSAARGWSLDAAASAYPPAPGVLFFTIPGGPNGDHPIAIFNDVGGRLDLGNNRRAGWYHSYAVLDLYDALEWQLAENHAVLDANPFLPLLFCYDAGFYPFVLSRTEVILFTFA